MERPPEQLLHVLAGGHLTGLGAPHELIADRGLYPEIPVHGFSLRDGWQCSDLHRCLH
jgi:hypothetical protein